MATIDQTRSTHEVRNQPPPIGSINYFDTDVVLKEALGREARWGEDRARDLGEVAGSEEAHEHARRAETNLPQLRTHDRYGNRVDEVVCDPSWHWLLQTAVERELPSLPWREERDGAHAVRAALAYLWVQVNGGVLSPVSMTYAAIPLLRHEAPALAEKWEPLLTKPDYYGGALAGQAMTEKQGGSDLRANSTRAEPLGDGSYEIWGHKWFCSSPMNDVFLTLAQAPEGLSVFLVERGEGMELQRLKDKIGTRSLPTAEVEFRGARGELVGEEGRGVEAIVRNLSHARVECVLGPAGMMRSGVRTAIHQARHRDAFGAPLAEQPAMANVLADLALESEATTTTMMRVARFYDEYDSPVRRLTIAVSKYWVAKRAPAFAAEALEVLGGNGYVEESKQAELFRESPVCNIWEGPGNVMALDVLRTIAKEPESAELFVAECERAHGADRRLDAYLGQLKSHLAQVQNAEEPQHLARGLVEKMALAFEASLLVRHAPGFAADAFCGSRLGANGWAFGTLPAGVDCQAIIDRAYPA